MPRPNFRHSKTRAGYIGASVVLGKGLAFDLRAGSSALLWIVSASFTPDSIPLLPPPRLPQPPSRVTVARAAQNLLSFADLMLPIVESRLACLPFLSLSLLLAPSLFNPLPSQLSIRDITITPTSYQLLSSPIPSISIVSKEHLSSSSSSFSFFCSIVSRETKTIDERTRELVIRFVSFFFIDFCSYISGTKSVYASPDSYDFSREEILNFVSTSSSETSSFFNV